MSVVYYFGHCVPEHSGSIPLPKFPKYWVGTKSQHIHGLCSMIAASSGVALEYCVPG
jgi:hypothetical protein